VFKNFRYSRLTSACDVISSGNKSICVCAQVCACVCVCVCVYRKGSVNVRTYTVPHVAVRPSHLPMELSRVGGAPLAEEAVLCFTEPGEASLDATCGEVGGGVGDLLLGTLGLADRFRGCAPSLSCKNQNSKVWPGCDHRSTSVETRRRGEKKRGGATTQAF